MPSSSEPPTRGRRDPSHERATAFLASPQGVSFINNRSELP